MYGSLLGNIAGIGYFLAYQLMGVLIALKFFRKESLGYSILMGSVLGSFALSWLPILCAGFMKFSVRAHIVALILFAAICFFYLTGEGKSEEKNKTIKTGILYGRSLKPDVKRIIKENPVLFVLIPLFVLVVIVLNHHTISMVDGAMHAGQSTYGDMNMHLGFITSIARQKFFPPEYSILPGTTLAYPFLSDSISSSIYIFGASLRIAYILPMFFALLQVFFGMASIAGKLIGKGKKSATTVLLSFALFFLNGGLGIWYFIHPATKENFTRIFTEFYETPTNLVSSNVYWHNVICDMLIPQRATLFGWAILFPVISVLLRTKDKEGLDGRSRTMYFALAGVLAGGLPLIHTHSFLALGVLCAGALCMELRDMVRDKGGEELHFPRGLIVFSVLFVLFAISMAEKSEEPLSSTLLLAIGAGIIFIFLVFLIVQIIKNAVKNPDKKWITQIVKTWGIFLGIVLICALPQLINFTFKQAQGEQFVRGAFNWANNNPDIMDNYIIFYLKNLGIVFVLFIAMLIFGNKKQIRIVLPACFLWLICEFIVFQPNPYDNNKLLLVSYLFFCIAVSDFVCTTIPKKILGVIKKYKKETIIKPVVVKILTGAIIGVTAFVGCISAVFTIGREYVSDYELYGADYVELCEWVEKNTDPGAVFLTATNHNNAVSSLTGRNIVCGAGTFLYYHGLDYTGREDAVRKMYEEPELRDELIDEYGVEYIVIGGIELGTYDIQGIEDLYEYYEVVYDKNGVVVFEV